MHTAQHNRLCDSEKETPQMHFLNPLHPLCFSPNPKLPADRGGEGLPIVRWMAFRKLCKFYQANEKVVWKQSRRAKLSGLSPASFQLARKAAYFFKEGKKTQTTQLWVNPAFLLIGPLAVWLILGADVYVFLHRTHPVLGAGSPCRISSLPRRSCYGCAATYAKALLQGIPINGIKD